MTTNPNYPEHLYVTEHIEGWDGVSGSWPSPDMDDREHALVSGTHLRGRFRFAYLQLFDAPRLRIASAYTCDEIPEPEAPPPRTLTYRWSGPAVTLRLSRRRALYVEFRVRNPTPRDLDRYPKVWLGLHYPGHDSEPFVPELAASGRK